MNGTAATGGARLATTDLGSMARQRGQAAKNARLYRRTTTNYSGGSTLGAMALDFDDLTRTPLNWFPDPGRVPILIAEHEGGHLELRLNVEFPDVPAYSLKVGEDEYVDFDDLPPAWDRGPLNWPDDAERVPYHSQL